MDFGLSHGWKLRMKNYFCLQKLNGTEFYHWIRMTGNFYWLYLDHLAFKIKYLTSNIGLKLNRTRTLIANRYTVKMIYNINQSI